MTNLLNYFWSQIILETPLVLLDVPATQQLVQKKKKKKKKKGKEMKNSCLIFAAFEGKHSNAF